MRTIGFVLLLIGGIVIFLSWNGKIGRALSAIITGNDPGVSSSNYSSTNQQIYNKANPKTSPQQNLNGQHIGAGFGPGGIING